MIETFYDEWLRRNDQIGKHLKNQQLSNLDFYHLSIAQLEVLRKVEPHHLSYISQQAEFYHLDHYLRMAGENYRRVLELDPIIPLTDKERQAIYNFCPILLTNPQECFPLKDVIAIHHPTKPLIGYHLFWEDDYDFPDDYEPCDHEEVWIEYDPNRQLVTNVMSWFHSRVLSSEAAVTEANTAGRAMIRIEWGKHGSLLCGWEEMTEPLTNVAISEWLKKAHEQVSKGGRVPNHPLKRFWPKRFNGDYEDYIDFSVAVDPLKWLENKPLMYKTKWVNATIFTEALLYNFHPKMEWPDRFFKS